MPSSTIDALFQLAAPRAAEPVRAPEAAPFDPALRQALAPGRRTEQPPAPTAAGEEREATADDQPRAAGAANGGAYDREADEAAESQVDAAAVDEGARPAEAESAEDEAEISEAAAAALAAEVKASEGAKAVPSTAEAAVDAVKAADAGKNTSEGGEDTAAAIGGAEQRDAAVDADEAAGEIAATDSKQSDARGADHDRQAADHNEKADAIQSTTGRMPGETPAEEGANRNADAVAKDEKTGEIKAPAAERSERRAENSDRAEAKQVVPSTASNAAVETAVVEGATVATAEATTELAAAKMDAATAAAAPSSAPRSAAGLEKLVGPRGVLPAPTEGTSGDGGAPVDRARFVQRVEGALRRAQDRDGRLHVRLSPPELGSLRVEISVQHGVLTAKLEAETTAARNLIMENLPALRERLAQQDVRIERFDVDVRRDGGEAGGGFAGDNGARERFADRSAWRQEQQRGRSGLPATARAESVSEAKPQANAAGLDVRV